MAETPRPPDSESPAPPDDASRAEPASAEQEPAPTQPIDRARARGRRIAFILFYSVALAVSIAGTLQIILQAFQRREAPELEIKTCPEGLSRLASAVDRARTAASMTDGEDEALADFRKALRPDWDDRDHIEDLCRPSASSMAALDAIERLRYAEENAVRREAAELAPLRRRVQTIAPREWGAPSADPPSAAPGR